MLDTLMCARIRVAGVRGYDEAGEMGGRCPRHIADGASATGVVKDEIATNNRRGIVSETWITRGDLMRDPLRHGW